MYRYPCCWSHWQFYMEQLKRIAKYLSTPQALWWVYVLVTIVASLLQYFRGTSPTGVTHYNNYVIFKQSFIHLLNGTNLYQPYPTEHWDLFKYSPAFALFMGLFYWLPNWLGLIIWNLLNSLTLFYAIKGIRQISQNQQAFVWWFVLVELITSLQNSQSNGLMAALVIFTFNFLQQKMQHTASFTVVAGVFVKVYGVVAGALFWLYPQKGRFIAGALLFATAFALVPMLVSPINTVVWQYQNWWVLLNNDLSASTGLSVSGWLQAWFGISASAKNYITVVGMLLFLLPWLKVNQYQNPTFRLLYTASILLWMVIFNHKAESPTFIIAMCGVALWYVAKPRQWWHTVILVGVFIFTSLSPTDLFLPQWRTEFIQAYQLKVFPCIVVWLWVLMDMLLLKNSTEYNEKHTAIRSR